jgi:predicted MFS family arabinose efflux permease
VHGRAGGRPTQRAAASGLRPAAPLPFVVVLDVTIVTTALPAIRQGLEFTDNELQWVFTAYVLVFGGLLICGGRVADVAGRRRTFLIGLGLFSAASAGCALAWSPETLVAGRVLQGAERPCSRPLHWPCSRRSASLEKRGGVLWAGGPQSLPEVGPAVGYSAGSSPNTPDGAGCLR